MKWTRDVPTESGWYWRADNKGRTRIMQVLVFDGHPYAHTNAPIYRNDNLWWPVPIVEPPAVGKEQ